MFRRFAPFFIRTVTHDFGSGKTDGLHDLQFPGGNFPLRHFAGQKAVTEPVFQIVDDLAAVVYLEPERVAGREETLGRIAREGHTLGVHSATHRYEEIYASDEALLADAETCAGVIRRVTGVTPHLYRFPGGGWDAARRSVLLEKKGYRVVRWNAECGDATAGATADELVETAIETSRGKNTVVLLMHDSAYRKTTAEALPRIIEYFRGQGYAFCAY